MPLRAATRSRVHPELPSSRRLQRAPPQVQERLARAWAEEEVMVRRLRVLRVQRELRVLLLLLLPP